MQLIYQFNNELSGYVFKLLNWFTFFMGKFNNQIETVYEFSMIPQDLSGGYTKVTPRY